MRAIAAISVVMLHTVMAFEKRLQIDVTSFSLLRYGNIGVDIFFIISGFIIAKISLKLVNRKAALPFLVDRVFRIYPIYWLYASIALTIYLARPDLVNSSSATQPNFLASYFLYPTTTTPILMVAWTLVYEMLFYMVLFTRLAIYPRFSLGFLALGWSIGIGAYALMPFGSSVFLGALFDPLVLEFLVGIVLALLPVMAFKVKRGVALLMFGLLFFALLTFQQDPRVIEANHFLRILLFGIPSLTLFYAMVSCETIFKKSIFLPLVLVGDASYSLYLSHIFVINGVVQIILRMNLGHVGFAALALGIFINALTIGWALMSYRFIEFPLSRRLLKVREKWFPWVKSSSPHILP